MVVGRNRKNNAGAIMAAALFFERIEAMRHFYHLTHDDRIKIEALLKEKHTPKEIANNIGCHISTIYRELKQQAGMNTEILTGQQKNGTVQI